jgi:STE24 endopeptidase
VTTLYHHEQSETPFPEPQRQEKAWKYNKLCRRSLFLELGICAALLLALLFTGFSAELAKFLPLPLPWSAALYLLVLVLGCGVTIAPLVYYEDFVLPHRYELSDQKLADWLKDKAKVLALGLLLGLCIAMLIYWLMENLSVLWWLAAGLTMFLLSLLLSRLVPSFLIPLFFKLRPLEQGELKENLANLAKRAGVNIDDVLTMDLSSKSTAANAMLAGWGKSRRIIISDTLLQSYSEGEIEVALAHELGHYLHHDIAKLMAIQLAIFLLVFYIADLALKAGMVLFSFQGVSDLTGLPWLVLILAVFGLILQPPLNWYHRHLELAADITALELSNNPQAFITLLTKLTDQNLQEAEPSRWVKLLFYDHPTYEERTKLARNYPPPIRSANLC